MHPITLGIRREVEKNRANDRPRNFYEYGSFQSRQVTLSIWGCNSRHQDEEYKLLVSAYDIMTDWTVDLPPRNITLGENRSTELYSGICPEPPKEKAYDQLAPSGTVVVHARLVNEGGKVVARYSDWPQPFKFLDLPDPGFKIERISGGVDSEMRLSVSVTKPVKGVWISVVGDDEGVEFEDNSLDLFPGDVQTIVAKGLEGKTLTAAWLGKEKADEI